MKIRRKIFLRVENHREIFLSASNLKSSNVIGQIRSLTIIIILDILLNYIFK